MVERGYRSYTEAIVTSDSNSSVWLGLISDEEDEEFS